MQDAREIPVVGDSMVLVGDHLLTEIPSKLKSVWPKTNMYVVVSDSTVFGHYGEQLMKAFADPDRKVLKYEITPGEASKSREVKAAIEDFMLANRCTRDTVVVALGGGVVGDLSGFLAATYMRGIPVVQIPTSVMAMVDSSVGGKTAINVPAGKNMVGAFHQPRFVFADMTLLRTLSRREVAEGLAEAIKMGVIRDARLFDFLEKEHAKVLALEPSEASQVIYDSIRHKADVVAIDEKETGLRATLNYGHTIGHAIEALMSPAMLHGECVSVGCVLEADLASRLGHLEASAVPRIRACF
jgi:pentafunctional AROM polypeptide